MVLHLPAANFLSGRVAEVYTWNFKFSDSEVLEDLTE